MRIRRARVEQQLYLPETVKIPARGSIWCALFLSLSTHRAHRAFHSAFISPRLSFLFNLRENARLFYSVLIRAAACVILHTHVYAYEVASNFLRVPRPRVYRNFLSAKWKISDENLLRVHTRSPRLWRISFYCPRAS